MSHFKIVLTTINNFSYLRLKTTIVTITYTCVTVFNFKSLIKYKYFLKFCLF